LENVQDELVKSYGCPIFYSALALARCNLLNIFLCLVFNWSCSFFSAILLYFEVYLIICVGACWQLILCTVYRHSRHSEIQRRHERVSFVAAVVSQTVNMMKELDKCINLCGMICTLVPCGLGAIPLIPSLSHLPTFYSVF